MDPIVFHGTLSTWSQADNPDELANLVLGKSRIDVVKDEKDARAVCKKIKQILDENLDLLTPADLPALQELQGLVHTFSVWAKESLEPAKIEKLENLVKSAIKLTQTRSDILHGYVSKDLHAITYDYFSIVDLMKLSLKQSVPEKILKNSIGRAGKGEIREFIDELCELKSNRSVFNKMIRTFFQHSTLDSQGNFFYMINNSPSDSAVLKKAIKLLPEKLSFLNLAESKVDDSTLLVLVERLNELKLLNLANCSRLTSSAIMEIAKQPHMSHLESLNLQGLNVNDQTVEDIAGSPHMSNLKSLNLEHNRSIKDAAIIAIANSPHMSHLESLNLGSIALTDAAINAIANSPHMSNLKSLNLQACRSLTDAAIRAIANSPHMAHLESLNLRYTLLTDEALIAIANSPYLVNLKSLDLQNNSQLTVEARKKILNNPQKSHLTVRF